MNNHQSPPLFHRGLHESFEYIEQENSSFNPLEEEEEIFKESEPFENSNEVQSNTATQRLGIRSEPDPTNDRQEIISIKFGDNVAEGLSRVKDVMREEKDIQMITIVFYDHEKGKVMKIRIKNDKNQAQRILESQLQKKKISKRKKAPLQPQKKAGNNQKNGPKLFGKAMIDFFYDSKNHPVIDQIIRKNSKKSLKFSVSVQDILDWIQRHRLSECFNKIQAFREFWSFKETENLPENIKAKTFKDVCQSYLNNEASRMVFSRFCRNGNKEMKLDNAVAYLGILPTFLKGVEDPQNFTSLK